MADANNGIVAAGIMDGGLLITFDDGRCAIYSTRLLLSIFSQTEYVTPDEDDNAPTYRAFAYIFTNHPQSCIEQLAFFMLADARLDS